ncbi:MULTISPECIES: TIGR04211 family SH3 domain-containing protein [Marinomonas]|uniref:TIGR04211 family SH3 domain-containing protein n=1 Tax=Marinomonas arenicola TaxID=569601 RepID=A0ABU9G567_9GAMM|nr:TIGR04211 family SH3 domain-containing protein [Marinomonas sp. KMM3893]
MSKKNITCILAGLLLSGVAQATTAYVSDIQFVAIREGQNNNTRAVERGIKSGTPLEVLEQENGYTKVKTPSGNEGWIADYFLSDDAVTRDQVISLQSKLSALSESKQKVNSELQDSKKEITDLNNKVTSLESDKTQLIKQIQQNKALAEKAQSIVSQNNDVSYQLESLKKQLATAEQAADQQQSTTQQKWFAIGAGTLLGGLIIGLLIPLSRKKKSSTSSWS